MSKIAIISDLHFGCRNDSEQIDKFIRKFYETVFFPYLDKNKITTVFCLGDVFDHRKHIAFSTLTTCIDYFFDQLSVRCIKFTCLAGNHDIALKNSNKINAVDLLLEKYDWNLITQEAIALTFDSLKILFVPWISSENREQCLSAIQKSNADMCLGHFEIEGFEMHRGSICEHGLTQSMFKHFDFVGSGHFHHRSTIGNITYFGNPYETTWNDYDDPRGFHVLDTETKEFEFFENPNRLFKKIYYNEDQVDKNAEQYKECFVKLIVENRTDFKKFDAYITKLNNAGLYDLKVIDSIDDLITDETDDIDVDLDDTESLLMQYVDSIDTDLSKDKIKEKLNKIYREAQIINE